MFSWYSLLLSISEEISNLDITKYNVINYIFNECSSLKILADISKWNTSDIINIKYIFNRCESLIFHNGMLIMLLV